MNVVVDVNDDGDVVFLAVTSTVRETGHFTDR